MASLKVAVNLEPNSPGHRYNLSLALIQCGQSDEAYQVLRDLVARSPEFALGHVCLGDQLLIRGAHREAEVAARKAVAADPTCAEAHILLARSLTEGVGYSSSVSAERDAEQHLRKALISNPHSIVAHALLGISLQQQGKFESAISEFELSLRLDPRQGSVYYGIAGCRKYKENDHGLRVRLEHVLESGDLATIERANVHYALGKVLEDLGEYEGALKEFDAGNLIMFELKSPVNPFNRDLIDRYVGEVIGTFDTSFFERQRSTGSKSEVPLIVLGMMRSGTSLVEQILSTHPLVAGGGELAFWPQNIGKGLMTGEAKFDESEAKELEWRYLDLLAEIGPNSQRVTDKMPQNTLYLGQIHATFPEARIIHCRRDPVDTCLSIYATAYGTSPDFAHSRANIVTVYKQYLRLMAHWRSVIPPNNLLEVDYEELIEDRESVTRRMIDFVGLDWDDACLHHETNMRAVKTPSRWQVRQPIYRTSIARWKNYEPWLNEFAELRMTQR